jgi:hypothetical protein
MPAADETPKAVFRGLPRKNLANFHVNELTSSESIEELLARGRLDP